jgi:predicted nucleic acid-binding protein
MAGLIVVLDACVLLNAALRDTLLRAAEAELYRAQWSQEIVDELVRNLVAEGRMTEDQARRLEAALQAAFPEAFVKGCDALIPALTCDPKDRHVLAAAVHAHAQVIVTTNLRHFPNISLAPHDIEAQHPDAFLIHLHDLDPDIMVPIIREQIADLRKPPQAPDRVLGKLALEAPRFVEVVRRQVQE